MRKLSKQEYLDKMRGCWIGKAIGGTLGFTYEARRGAWDLDDYPTDVSNGMIPNDDLDLQLIWLNAAERYKTELSAEKLTDYWLLGILPNWAEYGVGKSNMRMGLNAPASGKYNNRYKDSNGAWIRSEIWACIAPGHPEIAVKYAMEDAMTDHADEGVYAEIFTAALESAAFVESDKFKLIDIALSYIPESSDCAGAVKKIVELYKSGIDWRATRIALLNAYPDSFGGQLGDEDPDVPNGNWGYDAPSNLALTLIGWLYAEDDFGRAICITAGCGEDGDCTTGALGAILGIIYGAKGIPAKWADPIGEEIKTICCNRFVSSLRIPETMDELVRRTANLVPAFLGDHVDLTAGEEEMISVFEGEELLCTPNPVFDEGSGRELRYFRDAVRTGLVFRGASPLISVTITAKDGIDLARDAALRFSVLIENTAGELSAPLNVALRWLTPDGMRIEGGNEYFAFVNQHHCGSARNIHEVTLTVEGTPAAAIVNIVCELTIPGFASKVYVPVTLVNGR